MENTVCISVQNLYETFGDNLRLNTISTEDDGYFDLYNEHGELACMDGEEVNITETGDTYISFVNNNGEYSVYFALTHEEAKIAIIDETDEQTMFNRGASLKTVKKKISSIPWLTLSEERNFKTGETNIYYNNGDDKVILYFDSKKKYITGERLPIKPEETPLF